MEGTIGMRSVKDSNICTKREQVEAALWAVLTSYIRLMPSLIPTALYGVPDLTCWGNIAYQGLMPTMFVFKEGSHGPCMFQTYSYPGKEIC